MRSHDLARLLLSRRNNDMEFEVEVAPDGADEGEFYTVEMADDRERVRNGGTVDILRYDSERDMLIVKLATIFMGESPELPAGLCSDRTDHRPHVVMEGSLAPFWCTADQQKRVPYARESAL